MLVAVGFSPLVWNPSVSAVTDATPNDDSTAPPVCEELLQPAFLLGGPLEEHDDFAYRQAVGDSSFIEFVPGKRMSRTPQSDTRRFVDRGQDPGRHSRRLAGVTRGKE